MSNHVPPPYKIAEYLEHQGWAIIETVERGNDLPDKGYAIGIIYDDPSQETARFVVKACSTYEKMSYALHVIALSTHISRYLRENDPKALAQVREVLGLVENE